MSAREPRTERPPDDELSLVGAAATVWRYRWLVFLLCVVTLSSTFVITARMPKVYEATVTLLLPREGPSGLSGALASGIAQNLQVFSALSLTPNRDMLMSVLKSRRMAQAVVERFGLMQRGEPRSLEDAIKEMQAATTAAIREGVVTVKVEDTDPHLAAGIANFQVEHLDRLISQFGTGDASRQRRFLTEQLARAKGQLDLGEEELRRFKERNRAIVLEAQTQGAIEAAARLKGEIMATEVQLQVMRNFATEANPEVISLRRRIEEMRRQLGQVQYGEDGAQRPSGRGPGRDRREIYVPFSRVPELGVELARLTREVKVQETLVALISQQVEQTKMMESQDLPTIRVLDRATVPERPSKPSIRINLAYAGVASLLIGILLPFVLDFVRGLRAFAARRV